MRGTIVSFSSCKGGVGKTTLVANLGVYFSELLGDKFVIVDANLSAPNLAMHFGEFNPQNTIHDVLADRIPIEKALMKLHGVNIIPGSLAYSKEIRPSDLCEHLQRLREEKSLVLVDTAPGVGSEAIAAIKVSDEVVVVTHPDMPTVASTLKTLKAVEVFGSHLMGVALNLVRNEPFELPEEKIRRVLGWPILARIPEDPKVRESTALGVPLLKRKLDSVAARELRKLGEAIWKALKKK